MNNVTRRQFMAAASAGTIAAVASSTIPLYANQSNRAGKLAILGGTPVRTKRFPGWPVWDESAEEPILSVLRSGNWFRGRGTKVSEFEEKLVEKHLQECSSCNSKFENLKILTKAIRYLKDPSASSNFVLKVMEKLEQTCHTFETLSTYLDNELSNWNYEYISEHLQHCDKCNIVVNNLKTIIKVTGDLPDYEFSGDFVSRVFDKLDIYFIINQHTFFLLKINSSEKRFNDFLGFPGKEVPEKGIFK